MVLLLGCFFNPLAFAEDRLEKMQAASKKTFDTQIKPFISTYCFDCHGNKKEKGGVNFRSALKNPSEPSFRRQWRQALTSVKSHDMPPDDSEKQPTEQERKVFMEWVAGLKFLSPKDPGTFVIRRLNKTEYANTLRDFLGEVPLVAKDLPDEVFGAGYLNSISPMLMEQFLLIANDVLAKVAPGGKLSPELQKRLFGVPPTGGAEVGETAVRVVSDLARKGYRRVPTESEIRVLMSVFDLAMKKGKSYDEALLLTLKAILVSPQFLFITPGPVSEEKQAIVRLDDHQLAARLSYFIWATMPDGELSALADQGKLRDKEVLAAQTKRLLMDPRARALFDGFGAQWLGVDKLESKTFDLKKFPQMTKEMRSAMYDETRLFFESIIQENRNLVTFVDSDYTFLNKTNAAIYGLDASVSGSEMKRVALQDTNRGGILGMPAILATTSFPNRTGPVNRGVWVLEQVLGEHVPPPPPNVPTLEKQDKNKVANLTLRQRTELHRTNAVCANCHKVLDPIGFGLENFDAIGRWRDTDDSGGAIDAAGELPGGKKFSSPKELKAILADRVPDLSRNLTEKLLSYALGRQLEGYDDIVLDQLTEAIAQDGYRMQTLITQIVTSYPFTHRRTQDIGGTSNDKKLAH